MLYKMILCENGERTGAGYLLSKGFQSVKMRMCLVISLVRFVALSDHSQRASVNNCEKCNYSESNYTFKLCLNDDFEKNGGWLMVIDALVLTVLSADPRRYHPQTLFTIVGP